MQTAVDYKFPVHLGKVFTEDRTLIKDARAVMRSDNNVPLSVVSSRYKLFTHEQMVDTVEPFLSQFGERKTTYSVERDGTRFVMTSTFPNEVVRIGDRKVGDVVNLRLLTINSYDGTCARTVKLAGMVLRCLNGMTIEGGEFELKFPHTTDEEIVLPDKAVVIEMFNKAGKSWNAWAEKEATKEHQEFIVHNALKSQVISKRLIKDNKDKFEPHNTHSFWDYYNNFTNVLTHGLTKVQPTRKLGRMDRLNHIFNAAAVEVH